MRPAAHHRTEPVHPALRSIYNLRDSDRCLQHYSAVIHCRWSSVLRPPEHSQGMPDTEAQRRSGRRTSSTRAGACAASIELAMWSQVSTKQANLSSSFGIWAVNRSTTHIGPWHSGHCEVTDSSAPGDVELSSGGGAWSNVRQTGSRTRSTTLARTNYERREAPLLNRCAEYSILVTRTSRVWSANRSATG